MSGRGGTAAIGGEAGDIARLCAYRDQLAAMDAEQVHHACRGLTKPELRAMLGAWELWLHGGQAPPAGDWRVWMIQAGRGFGKTRAGAEWVHAQARGDPKLHIALVGATIDEVVGVMIRGPSGLLEVARDDEEMLWVPSKRMLFFHSGATATAYSGENPNKLRGPEHGVAWADELAKWARPQETWDNLMLGLRGARAGGAAARVLVTTTPRPIPIMRILAGDPKVAVTRGATADNVHLPPEYLADVTARYGGTRVGRQELAGELIDDAEGALWTRELIERCRAKATPAIARVVVGVDPPASASGDACGIVVCALGTDGVGYVLADHSVGGLSPEGWARAVAAAAEAHGADRVVAEANQGGAMVGSVLKAADCTLPLRLVHARRGKAARAEPVSTLFEGGRARFVGAFSDLEDELCGLLTGGDYVGPGRSPDRADAMVWALTELMLGKRGRPKVRGL